MLWAAQGFLLVDIESVTTCGGHRLFSGAFREGGGQALVIGQTWSAFSRARAELMVDGFRLVDLEVHTVGSTVLYDGLFHVASDAAAIVHGLSWDAFLAAWEEKSGQGLRLVDIEVYNEGLNLAFAGVFRGGTGGWGLWASEFQDFFKTWDEWSDAGLRLIDLEIVRIGSRDVYLGVYGPSTGGQVALAGRERDQFLNDWDRYRNRGYVLIDFEITYTTATAIVEKRAQYKGSFPHGQTPRESFGEAFPEGEASPASFVRGDVNGDGELGMNDALAILNKLYAGGKALDCADAADTNDNGELEMADALLILNFLYAGKQPPAGAPPGALQEDATPDTLGCDRKTDTLTTLPTRVTPVPHSTVHVLPQTPSKATLEQLPTDPPIPYEDPKGGEKLQKVPTLPRRVFPF